MVAKTNSKDVVSDQAGVADYIGSLKYSKQHPVAKLITINISCPNVYGGEPSQHRTVGEIVKGNRYA